MLINQNSSLVGESFSLLTCNLVCDVLLDVRREAIDVLRVGVEDRVLRHLLAARFINT